MAKDGQGGFSTRCVHAGERRDAEGAIHTPLYNHSLFGFPSTAALLEVVEGRKPGNLYTRYGLNPTLRSLEEKIAHLEGGERALAFSSGMAAETAVFMTYAPAGSHLLCLGDVYGGTIELLEKILPASGIETTFLLGSEQDQLPKLCRKNTRLLFLETPTNPNMEVFDIAKLAQVCRSLNILLVVDNTFASPYNQNPLSLGADLVIHSATKYLGGHSDLTGGVVVGSKDKVEPLWLRRKGLGSVMAPEVAFLLLRSLRTLAVRVERQNQTALAVAQYLSRHPRIAKTNYPGLADFPGHAIAKKQMRGFGGMISFEVKASKEVTIAFVDALKVFSIAPSLGGVESLVTMPVTTTHYGLSAEERNRRGISDSLVRISLGLEDAEDLIGDLEQALAAVGKG